MYLGLLNSSLDSASCLITSNFPTITTDFVHCYGLRRRLSMTGRSLIWIFPDNLYIPYIFSIRLLILRTYGKMTVTFPSWSLFPSPFLCKLSFFYQFFIFFSLSYPFLSVAIFNTWYFLLQIFSVKDLENSMYESKNNSCCVGGWRVDGICHLSRGLYSLISFLQGSQS